MANNNKKKQKANSGHKLVLNIRLGLVLGLLRRVAEQALKA